MDLVYFICTLNLTLIQYTGSRINVELMFWLHVLYSDCMIFGVIYNGLDIEVHDLCPAIYTTTTTNPSPNPIEY